MCIWYVHVCICVYVYMCVCVYVYMCLCMYMCLCFSVYVYLYMYICICICICISETQYSNITLIRNCFWWWPLMMRTECGDTVTCQWVWNSGASISYGLQTQNSLPVLLWIWTFARKLPEMHPYGRDPAVFIHFCGNSFFKIIRISSYNSNPSRTRRFQLSCFVWTFCVFLLQPKVVQRTNPR